MRARPIHNSQPIWPHAWVPGEEEVRNLWWEVSGISTIPRLLLLSDDGTLILDTNSIEALGAKLEEVFDSEG